MNGYQISPDQPPFPSPMNLPFQSVAGIQTSNLMSESFVGLISPATRQKAGKLSNGGPGIENGLGSVNVPAGSDFATVIVVSGRVSAARLSQVAAPADGARKTHAATAIAKNASHVSKVALHGVVDRTALIATPPIRQSLPDPPTSGNESVSGQPVTRAQSPRCQEWSHRVKGAPPALPSIVPPY